MSGMWQRIFIVFAKEVKDNVRDRRSLLVALIYPLMGPILLGLMMAMAASVVSGGGGEDAPKFTLHVQGAEYGPALTAYLEENGVVVKPAPEDPRESVRLGKVNIVLVISGDFSVMFNAKRTASVQVISNPSRLPGLMALNRVASLLGGFNQSVWSRRLADESVDMKVLRPLAIDSINVGTITHITDILLFMAPPLIIFNVFMGGVYLAIDTTSGERERGSLEPLLINPIERWGLMLGKFLAALLFTAAAVLVQLAAFKTVFNMMGGPASPFAKILSVPTLPGVIITLAPLMMLAVGTQFIIATLTRSFKEAQTYLGLLPLAPALPGLVMVLSPVEAEKWMMAVPAFSQTLLLGQFVRGESVEWLNIIISVSSSTALALILIACAAGLYTREELIFGG